VDNDRRLKKKWLSRLLEVCSNQRMEEYVFLNIWALFGKNEKLTVLMI